jgi:surface protein
MFEDCKKLNSITGLNSWTTTSVTDFSRMFFNTGADVPSDDYVIDVSGFRFNTGDDVSIVMTSMFNGSGAAKITFPATGGVKNATSINGMFQNCKNLSEVENFILNTDAHTDAEAPALSFPNLTGIYNLFTYCPGFKNVKLNISAPKAETINCLFNNCNNMTSLDLSGSDFSGCTKITEFLNPNSSLKAVYMNEVDLSKCKTAESGFNNMFRGASLTHLYMNRIKLDGAEDFSFFPYSTLKEVYLQEASLSAMTVLEGRFIKKTNVEKFDISYAKFGAYDLGDNYLSASQMFMGCTSLKTVIAKGFKAPKNLSEMFSGCTSLTTVDFENCDTVRTTTLYKMFFNCSAMEDFSNLSALNTTNVTSMESMFDGCVSAHGFDSSTWTNWNTYNVTTYKCMFHNFSYKTGSAAQYTINISNFDFSKASSFYEMFNCDEKDVNKSKDMVTTIVLPAGDKIVVDEASKTVTYRMFRNRWNLTAIQNIENFNTLCNITDAQSTFAGTGLSEIDVSSLDFGKITGSPQWMFNENRNLTVIYVKAGFDYKTNFIDRLNLTSVEMFKLDKKLKGPNGTSYTGDNDRWGSRARIDEDGAAGYFTEK